MHISATVTEELQIISRLRRAGAGAHLAEGCALERIPISDARKAAPSIILRAAKCFMAAQPAGNPDVQQEGNYWKCVRLCPGSWFKGSTVQPCPEECLASFCLIK